MTRIALLPFVLWACVKCGAFAIEPIDHCPRCHGRVERRVVPSPE